MFDISTRDLCTSPVGILTIVVLLQTYAPTQTSVGGGMLDLSCTNNPQFCNWNIVYLMYCDGDSFSGNRPQPLVFNGKPLYMRGHSIMEQVFTMVMTNAINAPTPYSQATDVVLSGCSAGGLSTFLHTDFVHDNYLPAGAKFWSVPISGFFLDAPNVEGQRVYTQQMQNVWQMQMPGPTGVNAACVAANPGNEWRCNMAEYTYQYIKAPIFPLNSGYDSWQMSCILTSEPVTPANQTNKNGNCSSAPGWATCNSSPNTCTNAQMIPVNNYYTEFISAMNNTATAANPQNGAFISSCHTHCEAVGSGWATFTVGGVAMRDAVAQWMSSGSYPSTSGPQFHWDCFYNPTGTPRSCNPTCGQSILRGKLGQHTFLDESAAYNLRH